ncbi:transcriptional regulator [Catenulispora sp. NL8]|uniref:Transcriptional regulator n=1 Tax=Catenulispora pinistramenti TaxID=2705254 RepID=A0ABS5KI98_9ACTN|nr:helix-turn-helix transcriptional regulator [Catenulispora pinistramenti]MBS2545620.1 transcriptional regulator [Catenulispora pinistramenti]
MGLRVNAAAQRRLNAIQAQLLSARLAAKMSQEALSEALRVTSRSLRDWERRYDSPSLAHALDWAQRLGFRLALADRLTDATTPPVEVEHHPIWQMQEYRLLAPLLKARRRVRKISQTDLGLIVGVTRSTLQRWEDGEQMPRLIALIVWADRLDYSVELRPLL